MPGASSVCFLFALSFSFLFFLAYACLCIYTCILFGLRTLLKDIALFAYKKKGLDRSYIERFKNKYYIKDTCVLPHSFGNNCKECINKTEYMVQYDLIEKYCVSGIVIPKCYLDTVHYFKG